MRQIKRDDSNGGRYGSRYMNYTIHNALATFPFFFHLYSMCKIISQRFFWNNNAPSRFPLARTIWIILLFFFFFPTQAPLLEHTAVWKYKRKMFHIVEDDGKKEEETSDLSEKLLHEWKWKKHFFFLGGRHLHCLTFAIPKKYFLNYTESLGKDLAQSSALVGTRFVFIYFLHKVKGQLTVGCDHLRERSTELFSDTPLIDIQRLLTSHPH